MNYNFNSHKNIAFLKFQKLNGVNFIQLFTNNDFKGENI